MSSRDCTAEYEERREVRRAAAVRLSRPWVQMRRSRYAVSPISPAEAYKRESCVLMWTAGMACVMEWE